MSTHIRVSKEFYEFIKTFSVKLNISLIDATRVLANSLILVDNLTEIIKKNDKIIIVVLNDKKQLIYYPEENIFNF